MNPQEILQALYAGEISPEDAKKALTIGANPTIESLRSLYAGKISLEEAKKALNLEVSPTIGTNLVSVPSGGSRKAIDSRRLPTGKGYTPNPNKSSGNALGPSQGTIPARHLQVEEPVKRASPAQERGRKEAIAIVGMSGQYPDAHNLSEYWDNLVQGKNAIREIPLSRFDVSNYYDPNPVRNGKIYCKWLGALDEIEYFDPLFFRLSPAEAEGIDPQHRLFLEEGYKAFEDAGYSPGLLSNSKCGIYLGIMSNEYSLLLSQQKAEEMSILGVSSAIAAARLAYLLNLKGPAMAIDTACSSSLVATHLACQALSNQEIDMALVGGVSLYLTPDSYIGMCSAGMLSPDGQCKTFDTNANGFVPGEGVGALVLKRLADAEADHDQIYGVIIASGMNQDGATNGMTAPSVKSQIELEREIYQKYHINPASISYVEMHGTGTKLGDPIELEALATVFQEKTQRKQYCAIGSVKSNIGHTSAAAGVAGVQKVLLSMKQKKIVPTLHFKVPNEHFDFEASPFYVNTQVRDWKSETGTPLRAAVSSFGFSGTNAHLVLEEYIPERTEDGSRRDTDGAVGAGLAAARSPYGLRPQTPCLFVLSAKSEQQLKSYAQEMKRWIDAHSELALTDIAFTLQLGRDAMDYRLAIVADSCEVLLQKLERFIGKQTSPGVYTAHVKKGSNDTTLFEGDADAQYLLHIWCQKKDLAKIAQVWVRGVNVDWKRLYTIGTGSTQDTGRGLSLSVPTTPVLPYRISLPTYPFAREYYWISTRGARHTGHDTAQSLEEETQTVLMIPSWKEEAILDVWEQTGTVGTGLAPVPVSTAPSLLLLYNLADIKASHIQAEMTSDGYCRGLKVKNWHSQQISRERRFQDAVVQLIQELQYLLQSRSTAPATPNPQVPVLVQVVIAHKEEPSFLEALVAVLKTAQQEYPQLRGQLIEVEGEPEERQLLSWLYENQHRPQDRQIRYLDGKRWVLQWQEHPLVSVSPKIPWKEGGCYLITGGTGGLARLFIQEIAQQVQEATIILIGRSALSASEHAVGVVPCADPVPHAPGGGIHIDYQQVDVSDGPAIHFLIQSILAQYGHLDGIIHAAGVLRDRLLLHKTPEDIQAVIEPKIIGIEHLDEASRQIPLDFFILCSSLAAVAGNVGQADYAVANAYLDAFAHARQALVQAGERQGTTVSINWPHWEAGGMKIETEAAQIMQERMGLEPMRTEVGMRTLYQALACGQAQVIVLHGQIERIKQQLEAGRSGGWIGSAQGTGWGPAPSVPTAPVRSLPTSTTPTEEEITTIGQEVLRERASTYFKKRLAAVIKLPVQQIDAEAPLLDYGFDSIMAMRFTNALEDSFGPLSKTLLFEYPTLHSVTEYFLYSYPEQLRNVLRSEGISIRYDPNQAIPQGSRGQNGASHDPSDRKGRVGLAPTRPLRSLAPQDDIAIIGISGRYPQARNLKDYWESLKAGRDCITEIPEERWSLEGFYHADPHEAVEQGKSYSKWGGFVEGFAGFDPLFFHISPQEALNLDPQERLFIETCWEALEDAGYTREQLAVQCNRKVGVFAGITKTGFTLYGPDLWRQGQGQSLRPHTSFSSVANRISYLLNLQGPSMPIDTMCSSSLTAIHEACEHIHRGECEMALAGGVNLYLHPSNYIDLCALKMLSVDGQCRSFGQGANGFVPGEGVGVVILKRLSRAITDHDQIYAVIRATGINHGGATNGYSVPNPIAQGELIRSTLDKAGINARTVSYIEAHGTGTELGDPIEVTGLTQAFCKDTQDTGFCMLGSVKSNIGHLEAAAGIAGVAKIILQMKHQQIVPSLHTKTLNSYINFTQTPFVVPQDLADWKQPLVEINNETRQYARIAGISSFGAAGANAHVVLEEYIPDMRQRPVITIDAHNPAIIVLSARNEEQLKKQVQQLREEIFHQQFSDENLADIAYTLQVGREAMEERLAIIVESVTQLTEKLEQFVAGQDGITDVYRGQVKRNKEALAVIAVDEDIQKAIDSWVIKRKYHKLLDLWVKGLAFDWNKLYGDIKPYRISLPTYPFDRERYWIPTTTIGIPGDTGDHKGSPIRFSSPRPQAMAVLTTLHPLVQRNTSTLWEQQFSSTFHGDEFFLADHVIKEHRIMPGVAYLEMAHAAVREAIGANASYEKSRLHLSHVVWVRPLIVGELPVTAHITLEPQDDTTLTFLISREDGQERMGGPQPLGTVATEEETDTQIYCQGRAVFRAESACPNVDLGSVQARCQHQISAASCYQHYREMGMNYGPTLQGIEQLSVGEDEVLARLRLPESVAQTQTDFVLHPSLLDAALQTCIGFLMERSEFQEPYLPFALSELSIISEIPAQSWAWVSRRQSSATGSVFDIEVCDDAGRIVLRLHGLSIRQFSAREHQTRTMLLTPNWKEGAIAGQAPPLSAVGEGTEAVGTGLAPVRVSTAPSLVLLCDLPGILASRIQAQLAEGGRCCSLTVGTGLAPVRQVRREQRFQDMVLQLIQELQRLLQSRPAGSVLVQVVVAHREEPSLLEALSGVLKTAQQEYPKLQAQLIEIAGEPEEGELLAWLLENQLRMAHEPHIRYRDGKRWVMQWQEVGGDPRTAGVGASPISANLSTMSDMATSDREGREGASPSSTQRQVDTRETSLSRGVDDELASSRPSRSPGSHAANRPPKFAPMEASPAPALHPYDVPWKEDGCYLITGGAGGLGRLFIQEITRHVEKAIIILIGRSPLSNTVDTDCVRVPNPVPCATGGIHIDYQQVDVTDGPAVHSLIQRILQQYGHLDGIIHAAGVLRDSLLLNKTQEEIEAVLAPKVIGVEHLDDASRQIPLDFFILCSSLAAVAGNVGQSDYAAANGYLDAFARVRQTLVMAGERHGTTVSINWPLWDAGGMQVAAETTQMMRERLGAEVMDTETGMRTLYQALTSGFAQVVVLHGQIGYIKQRLLGRIGPMVGAVPVRNVTDPDREDKDLRATDPGLTSDPRGVPQLSGAIPIDKLRTTLIHMVSHILKVRVEEIDAETDLSEYGFDSITLTQFANRLNQTYQLDLTPALFFEHSTIERLAQYLQATSATILAPYFAEASPLTPESVSIAPESVPVTPGLVPVVAPRDEVPLAVPISRQYSRLAHSFMQKLESPSTARTEEPIAIIGMSGMFPQSPDLPSFWHNLLAGRDCIGEIPQERWDWQTYFGDPATEPNKTNIKWAGLVEDLDLFDPLFFGISPREAEQMEPQQRLLMMYTWKAIEDAGYAAESLSGTNTALFVGTGNSGYSERVFRANMAIEGYSTIGLVASVGPNRVSYFLNLHGPSEAIDTACSSSLVAIHRGVNAIESGQCSLAIVGGVNTLVSPEPHISFNKAGMLSSDGRCKTFSAQANGYVRGEGVGMLVLKKLSEAEQAGDHIYGVIRGSAENHGGRASSLTAPNPRAQADLLIAAYRKAGIDPRTMGYIEAHGTGTELGDPIEINGLKTAFSELALTIGEGAVPHHACGIGSVKSNIGHLERAAGVAGVIKVLLQLQHKKLVKSLHCEQINPYIQLEGSPLYIVQENRDWEALRDRTGQVLPRRAGVSSFGFGGVNAHVVLEEYVPKPMVTPTGSATALGSLIVLSAKNEERLHEQVQQLLAWIRAETCAEDAQNQREAPSLQNLAYTLQVGRSAMEERLALQVSSLQELQEKLCKYLQEPQEASDWYRGQVRRHKETVALLNADEELQGTISKWFQRGQYDKLLQWWVKGLKIDWQQLYILEALSAQVSGSAQGTIPTALPRRISLPTYPFAKESYWIPTPHTNSESRTQLTIPAISQPIIPANPPHLSGQRSRSDIAKPDEILAFTTSYLVNILSTVLKISPEKLDLQVGFDEYGLDSIVIHQLHKMIEEVFGPIPSTTFFQYKCIGDLAQYFLREHEETVHALSVISVPSSGSRKDMDSSRLPAGKVYTPNPNESSGNAVGAESGAVGTGLAPVRVPTNPGPSQITGRQEPTIVEQDIAIIGISGQYPQSTNLDAFWSILESGRDCIVEIPKERWDYQRYYQPKNGTTGKTGGMYCKWGGFLPDIDKFDASFFHISPLEARFMDPQERLFLQTVSACFEDAGYSKQLLRDESAGDGRANVGVFAGVTYNNYQLHLLQEYEKGNFVPINSQTYSIANRVSYIYNLRGPSLSIDTACSSSLAAIHLACESIKRGECAMAIAGGVNLSLHPSKYISLCAGQFASSDGHCRSFGQDGDGYVPGEGVGAVLLKPLRDAIADGDHIYAVIKGTAINNDGKTFGYSVPNPVAQTEVIRKALEVAHVDPRTISYVEAHGTGTKLGDPIEITGLSNAFKEYTSAKQYCAIGSVKSNIGHLEAAAGIAQVTKVILQMKHKKLVPSLLHTTRLNPHIDFQNTPFFVQQTLEEWKQPVLQVNGEEAVYPRRAGISSFGAGGVNVHVVIEEYQAKDDKYIHSTRDKEPVIIVLSAKKEDNLRDYTLRLKDYMEQSMKGPGKMARLKDLAYTLQTGRDPMPCRLAFIARDPDEILKKLEIFLNHVAVPSSGSRKDMDSRRLPTGKVYTPNPNESSGNALGKNGLYIGYRTAEKRPGMEETLDDLATVRSSPVIMEKIAELWASGREIDWESMYQNERCFRVPLPTYPFSKERYWIGGQLEREQDEPSTEAVGPAPAQEEEDEKPEQPEISPFLAELCQALEGERQGMIEKYVQDLLASLLAFNPPDVPELHQGFFDMGMESVIAEQFRTSLEESFRVDIADTAVFDYPNISELSEYIVKHIPFSEIEKLDKPSLAAVGTQTGAVGTGLAPVRVPTAPVPVPTAPADDLVSVKQFLNELDVLATDDTQTVQAMSLEEVVDELSTLLNELEYNTHSS